MSEYPTYNMIYLGTFADIDADESTFSSEQAIGTFLGKSFGSAGDPLYTHLTAVTMHDTSGDGLVLTDNWSGTQENVSYTLPDGTAHAHEIDGVFSSVEVEVTRLLPDGATSKVLTMVRIMQDTSGNTFVMPPPVTSSTQPEVDAMTIYPIVAIRLPTTTSSYKIDYNAAYAGRHDMAQFVPCFAAGTLIRTGWGECEVENLAVGDLVWTRDHGLQPIRWIGRRDLGADEIAARPKMAPIRIAAGALGPGQPSRSLTVSPQHRILVRSAIARRMFGAEELLVAARQLTALPGIETVAEPAPITYVHLMFDRHEVLMSDGALTESFHPGAQALAAIGPQAEEILTLFPILREAPTSYPTARMVAQGRKARALADRHLKNARALA